MWLSEETIAGLFWLQMSSLRCQYPYYQRTFHVQATPVFVPAFEPYPLTQDLQEPLKARATTFCEQWETFLRDR